MKLYQPLVYINLVGLIIICSIAGVLIRFGLDYASNIPNLLYASNAESRPVNSVYVDILANAVGCAIMGMLVEWATELKSVSSVSYFALTSGFCGMCSENVLFMLN